MDRHEMIKTILRLQNMPGIGSASILELLRNGCTARCGVLTFSDISDMNQTRIGRMISDGKLTLSDWDKSCASADMILKHCHNADIDIMTCCDAGFPSNLLALKRYPPLLYIKGNRKILNTGKSAAIVGTREPTGLAKQMTEVFSRRLGDDGYVIISGLARGCDSAAHAAAAERDNPTIAVLGHGLIKDIYPPENRMLAHKIIETGGALISEYPPTASVSSFRLVRRDELQAGLSSGVICMESKQGGGSLHAVRHAVNMNKPVGILDHNAAALFLHDPDYAVADQSAGLNMLINESDAEISLLFSVDSILMFEKRMQEASRCRSSMPEYSASGYRLRKSMTGEGSTQEIQLNFLDTP